MKALTLTQPWASAVAVGAKRIETRSWGTKYRGPLAIHAAKGYRLDDLIFYGSCWNWCGALKSLGLIMGGKTPLYKLLPYGAIVATCDLVDCRRTDTFTVADLDTPRMPEGEHLEAYSWTERMMGDFAPGRYGWVLANVRRLPEPIPCKGALGLWTSVALESA